MTTMRERINNLELAEETICFAIARYSAAIHREQGKPNPDEAKIAHYEEEMRKMDDDLLGLRLDDDAGVQNAIEKYTLFLKKPRTALMGHNAA